MAKWVPFHPKTPAWNTMRGRVHFAPAAVKLGGIEEYKDLAGGRPL